MLPIISGGSVAAAASPVHVSTTVSVRVATSDLLVALQMPATVNSGDLLLAVFEVGNDQTISSLPSGFTEYTTGVTNPSSFRMIWKIADGTEGGSTQTVTMAGTNVQWHAVVMRITGAHQTTPIDAGGVLNQATSNNTTIVAPDCTATVTNTLACAFFMFQGRNGDSDTSTVNNGFTETYDNTATHPHFVASSIKTIAASGAIGATTCTIAAATYRQAYQVVIKHP